MELQQLRYLVAVARTGNFSRAAEQCHVSQPSLSQQIRKLEGELGERLFDRLKTRARLTPAGESLHVRAMRILAEVEAAGRDAGEVRALVRGKVNLGVLPTIAPYLLPKVLPAFNRSFPGLEVIVHEDTTARLLQLLHACEIDVALTSLPLADKALMVETLFEEELRVALPPNHRLTRQTVLRAADLDAEQFILLQEGHCLGDQVLSFCSRRDLRPHILCRSAQIETVRALVEAGLGISLIPAMACPAGPGTRKRYRSLAAPTPRRSIAAAWLHARPLRKAPEAFLEHLRRTIPPK